jgi:BASS family bile acid:Na+ symporter
MPFKKPFYLIPFVFLLAFVAVSFTAYSYLGGWLLMLFFFALAAVFRMSPKLRGFAFTVMIFAAVSVAMYYPQYFTQAGGFKLSKLIIPFLQVIMFGMGSELSLKQLAAGGFRAG